MSVRDLGAAVLRQQIPNLWAISGLQYRVVTSPPGTEPKTFAGGWVNVTGHFEEAGQTLLTDPDTQITMIRRFAWVTVADTIGILAEGSEFSINGAQPHWTVSGKYNGHRVDMGLSTMALVRDEPLSIGPQRGAQR